ncbi:hypothetical protein ACWGII_03005 [Streptomyces sp. NPDC054855]
MQEDAASDIPPQDSADPFSEVSEAYGLRYLRFALALPENWDIGDSLSAEQSDAVIILHNWLKYFPHMDPLNRWINLASFVSRRIIRKDVSNTSAIRQMCGGTLDVPRCEGDEVHTTLIDYASDIYPAFLVARPDSEWFTSGAFHNPDDQKGASLFHKAVLKDTKLRYLFPESLEIDPEALDHSSLHNIDSLIYFELGQGGTYQLALFAHHILNSAYMRCVVNGDDSFKSYIAAVGQNLTDARALASGRAVKIPVAIGFSNISISDVDSVQLPGGRLRRVAPADKSFLPPQVSVDTLLVLDVPMKIVAKVKHPRESGDDSDAVWDRVTPAFRKWQDSLQWNVDCHRLALKLADTDTHRSGAIQVLQAAVNPLNGSPTLSWSDGRVQTSATKIELDASKVDDVSGWVSSVIDRHPRSLRVAMRRILSAASSRTDPVDSLVDAVLAWENMFSDSPETSLRVCGSLSLLLEPVDRSKRKVLVKELTEIYGTRSSILHGSAKEPALETVVKHGDRALEVAVEAMRRLYLNPTLLELPTASARGKEVLLGFVEIN